MVQKIINFFERSFRTSKKVKLRRADSMLKAYDRVSSPTRQEIYKDDDMLSIL